MIYSKTEIEEGQLLLIDKPLNWTSFDVVNKLRYALRKAYGFKKLKVGHAGTLDPLATGLLLIAVGRKTKTINDLMGMDKVYTGTFKIGATTPSYDLETEVDQQWSTDGISEVDIQSAADKFKGLIDQVPPIFSAIKQGGKKAYEMAREGEKPELKSRQVMIHDFKVDAKSFPEVDFEVKCSKGTYIRSLAHDFGAALNNGAHLTALHREAIGPYSIEDALSLDRCLEIFQKEE
ncbi:tRNA pseudouridine(55) synthase TruB [Croceimicrobium hydrocarbonivorans]|uniref:tRNA pseudouridine synthase B n=1 Tax=Croceimicrobium hydrocarbonivorans TaxID=2761580 RepID=A0A7H0VAT4_9FLAO|nr:tRNA pseudouridine(55) synthase TruB [Croceimicrobium hydrocarbonivorans]QNR22832.1 tRNA pseudouridine(55) synthase TruB [Croceimicrobium hydrocarbonivorans]